MGYRSGRGSARVELTGNAMTDRKKVTLQEKHDRAAMMVARFTRMAALPNLTPDEAALALTQARGWGAAKHAYERALAYAATNPQPSENDLSLYSLLRIPPPEMA